MDLLCPLSLFSLGVLLGTVGDHLFIGAGIVASPELISIQRYARSHFPCSSGAFTTDVSPASDDDSTRHYSNLLPKQAKQMASFLCFNPPLAWIYFGSSDILLL